MTIATLPTPPGRADTADAFRANGDAFFGALATLCAEAQATETGWSATMLAVTPTPVAFMRWNIKEGGDSDPGAGYMNANTGSVRTLAALVPTLYLSTTGLGSVAATTFLDGLDDSTSTPKGVLLLIKESTPTVWGAYSITSVTTATNYRKVALTHLFSSSTAYSENDVFQVAFVRKGDLGTYTAALGNQKLSELAGLLYNSQIAATTTMNWTTGHVQKITAFSGGTITMTSPGTKPCRLVLQLPAAASPTTITWPAAVKWLGAAFTQQTANKETIIYLTWDGTYYWADANTQV